MHLVNELELKYMMDNRDIIYEKEGSGNINICNVDDLKANWKKQLGHHELTPSSLEDTKSETMAFIKMT